MRKVITYCVLGLLLANSITNAMDNNRDEDFPKTIPIIENYQQQPLKSTTKLPDEIQQQEGQLKEMNFAEEFADKPEPYKKMEPITLFDEKFGYIFWVDKEGIKNFENLKKSCWSIKHHLPLPDYLEDLYESFFNMETYPLAYGFKHSTTDDVSKFLKLNPPQQKSRTLPPCQTI